MRIALKLPERRAKLVNAGQDAPQGSREQKRFPVDPLHLIRSLSFSKFMRDQRDFSDALNAADEFGKKLDRGTSQRNTSDDVSRTARQTAFTRADILGMLLQRREFKANRLCNKIQTIHLFTDASPVTGEELQGMIMETILFGMQVIRDVLPGSTLAYGQFGAISKTIALYYGLWLVAGPFFCDMAWLVAKVKAIVTDGGNEARTVELPDIVRAFSDWMSGSPLAACRAKVNYDRRLFYQALRLSGWSHFWSGVIKQMANSLPEWPRIIEQVRTCIRFLRVASWRKHWKKCLAGTGVDTAPLNTVPASMAKWRYETVCSAFSDLAACRTLWEHHLRREWWVNPHNRALVDSALEVGSDGLCGHLSRPLLPCLDARRA